MSLIVVVGLVLAISGAAYAAICSLRGGWQETVKDRQTYGETCLEGLEAADDADVKKGRDKHGPRFKKSMASWNRSQWSPTILLGVSAILMTADVCLLDWSADEKLFFGTRPGCWCWVYKIGLLVMIVIDVWAIFRTYRSYHVIRDSAEELGRIHEMHSKLKLARMTAQPASGSADSSSQGMVGGN